MDGKEPGKKKKGEQKKKQKKAQQQQQKGCSSPGLTQDGRIRSSQYQCHQSAVNFSSKMQAHVQGSQESSVAPVKMDLNKGRREGSYSSRAANLVRAALYLEKGKHSEGFGGREESAGEGRAGGRAGGDGGKKSGGTIRDIFKAIVP